MANWHGTTCTCGRIFKKMHCSACGSTNLQGLAKIATHIVADDTGTPIERQFKSYRCRACAEVSDEWITLNCCRAPQLETLASRRSGPIIPRENRREKIEEVLRMAGLDPNKPTGSVKPPMEWKDEFFPPKEDTK
jgi:hypothetical protein